MRTFALLVTTALLAACGEDSPPSPPAPADSARYMADITTVTGPRTAGTAHHQEVQDLCASRFAELGFTVERHAYGTGTNVVGVLRGTSKPDERVYLSAHYDSVANCAGADDNASGVAGVLEAARLLTARKHARTLVVACWDQEEFQAAQQTGLVGSRAWVTGRAVPDAEKIVGSFVFEMIGYRSDQPNTQMSDAGISALWPDAAAAIETNMFRGDFVLIIHDIASTESIANFVTAATEIELPTIILDVDDLIKTSTLPQAQALRRSDHAPFWDANIPAAMFTDSANFRNPNYHCGGGPDVVSDLDIGFATKIVTATTRTVAKLLDN